jgi:hypothetical protein
MDYNNSFEKRAKQYNSIITAYPHILKNEFVTAITMCDIKSNDILLNILAGGIPLNDYFIIKPQIYKEYTKKKCFVFVYRCQQQHQVVKFKVLPPG